MRIVTPSASLICSATSASIGAVDDLERDLGAGLEQLHAVLVKRADDQDFRHFSFFSTLPSMGLRSPILTRAWGRAQAGVRKKSAEHDFRQPGRHAGEQGEEDQHEELDQDERDHAPVDLEGRDLGRGDAAQVEEGKAEGRASGTRSAG